MHLFFTSIATVIALAALAGFIYSTAHKSDLAFLPQRTKSRRKEYKDEDKLIKYFELYRSYMIHESDLINQRINWLLSINGFLFAALGISFQNQLGLQSTHPENSNIISFKFSFFVILISLIGLVVSLLLFTLIRAAKVSARCLEEHFGHSFPIQSGYGLLEYVRGRGPRRIPRISSAGLPAAFQIGRRSSSTLPVLFAIVWIIIGFASMHQIIYKEDILDDINKRLGTAKNQQESKTIIRPPHPAKRHYRRTGRF